MNANKKAKSVLAALLAGMMVFASACNQVYWTQQSENSVSL